MEAIKFTFGGLELTNEVINRLADLGYTLESLQDAISKHEWKHQSDSPALYCGTYGKYNSGSFNGIFGRDNTCAYFSHSIDRKYLLYYKKNLLISQLLINFMLFCFQYMI